MRSIAKIAVGTALGILLAGVVTALVVFGLFGAATKDASDGRKSTARAAAIAPNHDIDGDGRPDTTDPDPYSANSAPYKAAPKPTPKRTRKVSARASAAFVACDANISVRAATTTCPFAQNVFYGYWEAGGNAFSAYSSASEQSYEMSCSGGSTIICGADDGAEVRFRARAVRLYDQSQADTYAATHDLGPESDALDTYADEDGEGYDDYDAYEDEGDGSTEPGENIPYYDEGDGYRVQCADGTYSQSGGIQGACSHHGGLG